MSPTDLLEKSTTTVTCQRTVYPLDRPGDSTKINPIIFPTIQDDIPDYSSQRMIQPMEEVPRVDPRRNLLFIKRERKYRFEFAREQLNKCKGLENGWDSYDADPPSDAAISNTDRILDAFENVDFLPSSINPSVEGGLGITFVENEAFAYIECSNDGEILVAFATKDKSTKIIEITWRNLKSIISEIREFLQRENTDTNDPRGEETGSGIF